MSDNELKNKSIDHLENILEALEAQSRFTEIQIKEVKKELEERKRVLPSGVPLKCTLTEMPYNAIMRSFVEWFQCEASADKFENYLVNFIKALQDIAEGKQIDIKALLPLLPKGYVAMEKNNKWFWYADKPTICLDTWIEGQPVKGMSAFNIKAAEDWTQSLKESGL